MNRKDEIEILKTRFHEEINRHKNIKWEVVEEKLITNQVKLDILIEMEQSGGEPDVIDLDEKTGEIIFFDCSKETPVGRRGLCYDKRGLASRKDNKPNGSALEITQKMGVELLTEEEYFYLQNFGEFDTKTSSWLKTPQEIRKLGGALFGERRYNRVFIFHNTASSYYGVRGFRTKLKI